MLKISPGNQISIKRKRGKPTNPTKLIVKRRRNVRKFSITGKISVPKL
jgi:hypothetical protein